MHSCTSTALARGAYALHPAQPCDVLTALDRRTGGRRRLRRRRGTRVSLWIGAGVVALGLYGFVATLQPEAHFGRILAAHGGVFVAGSLLWGVVVDGFRPDRFDVVGAAVCLAGVALIMYAPRGS